MTKEPLKHEYTDEVVCPYCGHKHDESYEFFNELEETAVGVSCGMCDREFNAVRRISVDYSTQRLKGAKG